MRVAPTPFEIAHRGCGASESEMAPILARQANTLKESKEVVKQLSRGCGHFPKLERITGVAATDYFARKTESFNRLPVPKSKGIFSLRSAEILLRLVALATQYAA
jgi:hypothetical protein